MSEANQFTSKPTVISVTVAISGQVSDAFSLFGCNFAVFETPAAITGTTYTFQGSIDGGATYTPIYNEVGSLVTYSNVVVSGSYPLLNAAVFYGYDKLKIDTGDTEVAERTIKVKVFPL